MKTKFEKLASIIKLVYEIKNKKTITIFHPYFVEKNKINCKIIINNKMHLLTDKYQIVDENLKLLKVKLLILNNKKIDLSFMFCNCDSLKNFNIIAKEVEKTNDEYKNEDDNYQNNTINTDSLDDLNNQLDEIFKYNNNCNDITINIFNQAIKIYYD